MVSGDQGRALELSDSVTTPTHGREQERAKRFHIGDARSSKFDVGVKNLTSNPIVGTLTPGTKQERSSPIVKASLRTHAANTTLGNNVLSTMRQNCGLDPLAWRMGHLQL